MTGDGLPRVRERGDGMIDAPPLTPEEIEAWRYNLEHVIQPERHSLRLLATIEHLTQDHDRLQRELDGARKLSGAQSIILGGAISHLTEPNATNDAIARLQREKEDLQEEVERLRSREMTEERIEAVAFAVAGQLMAYQPIELGATTVVWNAIREAIGETK